MKNMIRETRRGFSLVEGLAVVLVLSMIGMSMGPSLQEMRSRAMGIASVANMQEIGVGAAMYAGANDGRMFSYSWRAGETYTMPDGREWTMSDDSAAATRQNTEILMRRTGRVSGEFKIKNATGRLPHRRFTHLVLNDFLNIPLEDTTHIDPADTNQLFWHANPLDNRIGSTVPYANGDVPAGYETDSTWPIHSIRQRWAFASSYQNVPSAWQPDTPNPRWLPIESTPHLFSGGINSGLADGRNMNQLMFPAHKVWMFEEFDREAEGSPYFGYDHARSAKLMFDGAVNVWASGDAYPSVIPEFGFPYEVWEQRYVPLDTFPVPLGGLGDDTELNQRFRWTYRGLLGVDYGPGDPDGR